MELLIAICEFPDVERVEVKQRTRVVTYEEPVEEWGDNSSNVRDLV